MLLGKILVIKSKFLIGELFLSELQAFEKAIEIFNELTAFFPNEFEFALALAKAYAQSEQESEAVDILQNFLKNNPDNEQARQWLSILTNQ